MNATEDKTYNGWKNYETWVVNLWIENEIDDYHCWQAEAQLVWNDAEAGEVLDKYFAAKLELSNRMKSWIEENTPDICGIYTDLLNAAISEVDFIEIAEHYIESVERD